MNRLLLAALISTVSTAAFAAKAAKTTVSKPTKQDTTDDPLLDTYLSPKIDKAQAIDAAGLHQDKAAKQITSAAAPSKDDGVGMPNQPNPSDQSASTTTTTDTADGGIVDPKLDKMKKLNGSEITSSGDADGKSVKFGNDVLPITNLHTYDSLRAMPEHQGAHGIARVSAPGEAYAVGMMTYSAQEFAQLSKNTGSVAPAMTGHCWGAWSPRVTTDTGCTWHVWVSAAPGGNPAGPHCAASMAVNNASGPSVIWYNPNPGHEAEADKYDAGSMCKITGLDKRYYCNYIATGWDSQYKPQHCDFVFSGPLSASAADNPPDQTGSQASFAQ